MSLPQGPVWQQIRQRALDSIPPGSRVDYREPLTLRQWHSRGSYRVTSLQRKKVELVVFSDEFGGVLLTEAEHYLDHAAEHQLSIWGQLQSERWQSPAWQIVTVYYWAYYLGVALTRLLGRSVWFVDDSVAASFNTLGAGVGSPVGAGAFSVSCGQAQSAIDRTVILKMGSGRVHEHLWRTLFVVLDVLTKSASPTLGSAEERLYRALLHSSRALGPDWPSAIRNLVNYRPGLAYRAVRGDGSLAALTRRSEPMDFADVLEALEQNVMAIEGGKSLERQVDGACRCLVSVAFVMCALVREVYEDTISRNGVDPRWRQNRDRFLSRHGVRGKAGVWPC